VDKHTLFYSSIGRPIKCLQKPDLIRVLKKELVFRDKTKKIKVF
jgi:hypothetical protein